MPQGRQQNTECTQLLLSNNVNLWINPNIHTTKKTHFYHSGVDQVRPFPHLVNGSSVNRLGLAESKSASVLSLRSSTLTRGSFRHNEGSELRLLAL